MSEEIKPSAGAVRAAEAIRHSLSKMEIDFTERDLTSFAAIIDRETVAELEQIKKIIADPVAVHLNMMRGTIAWTPENLRHLLGDEDKVRDLVKMLERWLGALVGGPENLTERAADRLEEDTRELLGRVGG